MDKLLELIDLELMRRPFLCPGLIVAVGVVRTPSNMSPAVVFLNYPMTYSACAEYIAITLEMCIIGTLSNCLHIRV